MDARRIAWALAAGWFSLLAAQQPGGREAGDKPGINKPVGDAAPRLQPTDAKDRWPSDFARFVSVGDGGHFDTAITTYRNADGAEVKLFAAVHVADAACYQELQRRFEACESLLYELVGPEEYRPKKGDARGASFVSLLQQGMKNGLELEFQLDGIDYSASNFVHADMTPEEFKSSMDQRGETLFGMLWQVGMKAQAQMMADAAAAAEKAEAAQDAGGEPRAQKPAVNDFDLIRAFRSGAGRHMLRLAMAQQLEGMEIAYAGGEGSTLLEGRNEKCLEVLKAQLAAGKKKLGVYYGGAHLTHMEKRLCEDMGFKKVDHEWIVAWDCTKRADPKVDRELWRQRRKAKVDLDGILDAALRWREDHGGFVPKPGDLRTLKGSEPYWSGDLKDPWGHDYAILGGDLKPYIDVRSFGEDGKDDSADDLHTASPRELRRLRPPVKDAAPEPAKTGAGDERAKEDAATALARSASIEADLKAIYEASQLFKLKENRLPTVRELATPDQRGRSYLQSEPFDPWGHAYEIRADGNKQQVRCAGPDGRMDTADDVVHPKPK